MSFQLRKLLSSKCILQNFEMWSRFFFSNSQTKFLQSKLSKLDLLKKRMKHPQIATFKAPSHHILRKYTWITQVILWELIKSSLCMKRKCKVYVFIHVFWCMMVIICILNAWNVPNSLGSKGAKEKCCLV